MSKVVLFAASLLMVAGIASAGIIAQCNSPVLYMDVDPPGPVPECYTACPRGDTPNFISQGFWFDVTVNDLVGNPISGIPFSDFWLVDCDPARNLCYCSNPCTADRNTDALGNTEISASTYRVGGCANGVSPVVQGLILQQNVPPCTNYCFQVNVRSFDVTCDLVINIADLAQFATWYPPNPYNTCGDFNCDGAVNISDLAQFGFHFGPPGHTC